MDMDKITQTFLGMATGRRLTLEFIECDRMHEGVDGWAVKVDGRLYGSATLSELVGHVDEEVQRIRKAVKSGEVHD